MHAAVEHAAAERGPGSALVRAPHGCRPAGADSARTRRGIRGLGGADSRFFKRRISGGLDSTKRRTPKPQPRRGGDCESGSESESDTESEPEPESEPEER